MTARKAASPTLGRDVTVLGLTWGASIVLQRVAVSEQDAVTVVFWRLVAATLAFTPVLSRVWRGLAGRPRLWFDLGVIGAMNPVTTGLLSALALQHVSSGMVAVFNALGPVFTALFARFMLREPPLRRLQVLGLALALGGVFVLVGTRSTGLSNGHSDDLRGPLLALLIPLIMAVATVYSRRQLTGVDPLAASAGQVTTAFLITLPLTLLVGSDVSAAQFSPGGWLAVVLSGSIGLSVSFILFLGMIERHGPTAALLALYVMPVAAALLGTLFLGESLTAPMLVGASFVLLGVALFTRR